MYTYMICNQADEEIFRKQCDALERRINHLRRRQLIEDVDGSLIQIYNLYEKELTVHNSIYLDEVYINSEIDLDKFF